MNVNLRGTRTTSFAISAIICCSCTTFSNVRSAEIDRGLSTTFQGAVSTPVPSVTGWFWSFDCVDDCGHPVGGGDITFTYGARERALPGPRVAIGGGLNGLYPYLEGYVQLAKAPRPFGIGARLGLPSDKWFEHQIYARHDVPIGSSGRRVLINPALFIHHGRSPNGQNPGSFVGFVQGLGVLLPGERVSYVPAMSLVVGRAQRTSYRQKYGPETAVFGTLSLSVTYHRLKDER